MLSVLNAIYLDDYKIDLSFNDGNSGVADLHDVIFNDTRVPFLVLRNKKIFRKFKIEHQTLVWENGLDLAPEFLFFVTFKNRSEFQEQFMQWGYTF